MELPFASEDLRVRYFSIVSAAALAVLAVFAGMAMLFAQKVLVEYDMEASRPFVLVSGFGLGGIAAAWCLYMAALVGLLGYDRSEWRPVVVVIVFGLCALYLLFVLAVAGDALSFSRMVL